MVDVHTDAGVGVGLRLDLIGPLVQHRGGAYHQRAALQAAGQEASSVFKTAR